MPRKGIYKSTGKPEGRPPKINEPVLQILETAFSVGSTNEEAAASAKIAPRTLYYYLGSHPEFVQKIEAFREVIKLKAKKNVVNAIEGGDLKQSNWWLERKAKDEFSTRIEATGKGGGPVYYSLSDMFDAAERARAGQDKQQATD